MAVDVESPTSPSPNSSRRQRRSTQQPASSSSSDHSTTKDGNKPTTSSFSSSVWSRNSLSSLRSSLPENPHLYDISEIRAATNNFLAKNYSHSSSSSRSWRCNLQGKEVIIFQRKLQQQLRPQNIRQKLSSISKSHHIALVNLLGASISDDYIYLVYEFIHGANLADLLHNRNNPDFTVLNTWMSRMQIVTDLANGLDYIHHNTGLDVKFVHNHIKSTSVIVTEPSFNAKISHFGTAELCGEPVEERETTDVIDEEEKPPKSLARSNSVKFNGTRGYMPPELQSTGIGTRKSDVYAFGMVLLELLSGEDPVKYRFNKERKEYVRISVADAAREAVDDGAGREGTMRKWVDRRLKDSFPVEVAAKITRLALDCIHVDPDQRPDMRRVAGKISKLYLESRVWCDRMKMPTDITVSFGPR
ncbi:hypothetical protein Cgig2_000567 [Carnegiea gigantea]|uniref:Protein kinase domain-containing protein n=1 Tax=Carnegiea gigantea TaxID=171969 RepID=A0A9Q1JIC1_9CARY|nr:hypothetical protein Cgig2_000567 [Carnegiea gigantea]